MKTHLTLQITLRTRFSQVVRVQPHGYGAGYYGRRGYHTRIAVVLQERDVLIGCFTCNIRIPLRKLNLCKADS